MSPLSLEFLFRGGRDFVPSARITGSHRMVVQRMNKCSPPRSPGEAAHVDQPAPGPGLGLPCGLLGTVHSPFTGWCSCLSMCRPILPPGPPGQVGQQAK